MISSFIFSFIFNDIYFLSNQNIVSEKAFFLPLEAVLLVYVDVIIQLLSYIYLKKLEIHVGDWRKAYINKNLITAKA